MALIIKPLTILFCGTYGYVAEASKLTQIGVITTISTSALSASLFREYLPKLLEGNKDSFGETFYIQITCLSSLFIFSVNEQACFWLTCIFLDFIFHTFYRIQLYKKSYNSWLFLNLLSWTSSIILTFLDNSLLRYVKYIGISCFISISFYCYFKGYRFRYILRKYLSVTSMYALIRKVFINKEKFIFSSILGNAELWKFGLVWQSYNLSVTTFESIVIFPNKAEFIKDNSSIRFDKQNRLYYCFIVIFLASIFLVIFFTGLGLSASIYCIILSIKLKFHLIFLYRTEKLFWSNSINLMIYKLSMITVAYGVICVSLVSYNNLLVYYIIYPIVDCGCFYYATINDRSKGG